MAEILAVKEFLGHPESMPTIDVRSPAEYSAGHIIGAINIPLFDNEERKTIGTLYKQRGREEAIRKGFELLAPKVEKILHQVRNVIIPSAQLRIYCWRGGLRSSAMAWLFEKYGFPCSILSGGYKSYRNYLHDFFRQDFRFLILGGMTGTGKTSILKEIGKKGQQVIDLESLANHKGSAFGALGEKPQPSTEHFENLLFDKLRLLVVEENIWLEDESRNIGKVTLPTAIFLQLRSSPLFFVETGMNKRIDNLLNDYGAFEAEEIISSIGKIEKRLGSQNTKSAIEHAWKKDYKSVIEIILAYYDKTYLYGLNKRPSKSIHNIVTGSETFGEIAEILLQYVSIHNQT